MKTLVLDLDETLVHSSYKDPGVPNILIPVEIEDKVINVYVLVRPGAVEFFETLSQYYEIVIYTASLSKYADPLMDILDTNRVCGERLFREHCTYMNSIYIKDLSTLGRPMTDVILVDNSPNSYLFQPENAMPILNWYNDESDTVLDSYIPFLTNLSKVKDVRPILSQIDLGNNYVDLAKGM